MDKVKCSDYLSILHLNVAGLLKKYLDIYSDDKWKKAHDMSFDESWLNPIDTLFLKMFGLTEEYSIFRCARNNKGGGVVVIVHTKLKPFQLKPHGTG